jgi:hypothetical protein
MSRNESRAPTVFACGIGAFQEWKKGQEDAASLSAATTHCTSYQECICDWVIFAINMRLTYRATD